MPPIANPLINGRRFSWASLELSIDDTIIPGVLSIDYDDGSEPGIVRGTDSVALGKTAGQHKVTCSMKMLRSEFENLKNEKLGGVGFMKRDFGIVVTYFEESLGVIADRIEGLNISNVKAANSDSTDASAVELTLMTIVPIFWNGIQGITSKFI